MSIQKIGFLHPGAMGISLAATAINTGCEAYWVSEGRSSSTRERSEKYGLKETESLQKMCGICDILISVCPPSAAMAVAEKVAGCSYQGIYADVNAISPDQTKQIGQIITQSGARYVDGGIIGLPAWKKNSTYLYLSGPDAQIVADCFSEGPLVAEVIGEEIGKASALKMCFAANTKGTIALQCAVTAAAEKLGVRKELEKQWAKNGSDYAEKTLETIQKVTAKAWRFTGEMEEIASTFESAGLPGGFHKAAYDIYERIAGFKDSESFPPVEEILKALLRGSSGFSGRE